MALLAVGAKQQAIMTADFQRVRSVFMAALERPPEALESYLAGACGGDAGLREQVEVLLQAHRSGRGILDGGPDRVPDRVPDPGPDRGPDAGYDACRDASETAPGPSPERAGEVIAGRYKLVERIGEGGMGSVWLAEQSEPVRRKVARQAHQAGHGLAAGARPASRPSGRRWR